MGTNRLTFSNELCATAIRIEWKKGRCRRGEKRQRRESNGEEGRGRLRRKEGIENPPLFSILKTLQDPSKENDGIEQGKDGADV